MVIYEKGVDMKKVLTVLLMSLIFQSFVYADTVMNRVMNSWKGESIDVVIKHWGYPNDEKNIAGHKCFTGIRIKALNMCKLPLIQEA